MFYFRNEKTLEVVLRETLYNQEVLKGELTNIPKTTDCYILAISNGSAIVREEISAEKGVNKIPPGVLVEVVNIDKYCLKNNLTFKRNPPEIRDITKKESKNPTKGKRYKPTLVRDVNKEKPIRIVS